MEIKHVFSGFAVTNQAETKDFYRNVLGLEVEESTMGLTLKLPNGGEVFIYAKPDYEPASFTILNIVVHDIDKAVEELTQKGIEFEKYDNLPAPQDEIGVLRGLSANQGPDIAWFKDPSGNILSILQNVQERS